MPENSSLVLRTGVIIGAYGTGAKPIINGSAKNYAAPALWLETEIPNVYISMTDV